MSLLQDLVSQDEICQVWENCAFDRWWWQWGTVEADSELPKSYWSVEGCDGVVLRMTLNWKPEEVAWLMSHSDDDGLDDHQRYTQSQWVCSGSSLKNWNLTHWGMVLLWLWWYSKAWTISRCTAIACKSLEATAWRSLTQVKEWWSGCFSNGNVLSDGWLK